MEGPHLAASGPARGQVYPHLQGSERLTLPHTRPPPAKRAELIAPQIFAFRAADGRLPRPKNRASRHISLKSVSTHKIGCGCLSHRWIRVHGSVQPKVKLPRRFSRSAFRGTPGVVRSRLGLATEGQSYGTLALPYCKPNPTLALALAL